MAANLPTSVHMVDSGWFIDMLMRHRNPQEQLYWFIYILESKSVRWFDHNFIIIPFNENGTHWTLLAIDIKKKTVNNILHLSCSISKCKVCMLPNLEMYVP